MVRLSRHRRRGGGEGDKKARTGDYEPKLKNDIFSTFSQDPTTGNLSQSSTLTADEGIEIPEEEYEVVEEPFPGITTLTEEQTTTYIKELDAATNAIMKALESLKGGRRKRGGNRTERKDINGQTYDVTYDDNNNEISRVLATTATTNAGNGSGSGSSSSSSSSSTTTSSSSTTDLDTIALSTLVTEMITKANTKLKDWADKSWAGFAAYVIVRVLKAIPSGVYTVGSTTVSGVSTVASGIGRGTAAVVGTAGCSGRKRYVTKFVIIAVLVALGYFTSDKIEELAKHIGLAAYDQATNAYQSIMDFKCTVGMKQSFLENQFCNEYANVLNDIALSQSFAQQVKSKLVQAGGFTAVIWGTWNHATTILSTAKNLVVGTFTGANAALEAIVDAFCETKETEKIKDQKKAATTTPPPNTVFAGSSSSSTTTTTTTASPGSGSGSGSGSGPAGPQTSKSKKERSGSQTRNGGRRTRRHQQKRRHTRRY